MNLECDECSTALYYATDLRFHQLRPLSQSKQENSPPSTSAPIPIQSPENKYQLLENFNFGAVHENLPECNIDKKYYLTTAIAYTNGYPHIGHAYEVNSFHNNCLIHILLVSYC